MKNLIDAYLKDHETAWTPATLRSESSRLRAIVDHMVTPDGLYKYLLSLDQKPYTIKTTFIRVVALEKWANLTPTFRTFMEKHNNRFKHAYQKEELELSYADVVTRINQLDNPYRAMALCMLNTGLRLSETYQVKDNKVAGKGGKVRKVYGTIKETAPKTTFARKLKAVGLKPHMLRKLCATRLAEKGASPADLCKVLGWSSISTAYQYLQAREESKLEALMATCQEKP